MELQALLVLCGVGVAGVAVVLLMGLFSASGTSYEEAIAQQRKAATELLALAENKTKPKKKEKKAIKKLAKKERNKEASIATGSEPESETLAESGVDEDSVPAKLHVEFSPPVVVEDLQDSAANVKIRKRGKDSKVKPILINKEDPSCISDTSVTTPEIVTNHFEESHPKDDFELMQSIHAAEKTPEKKEVAEKKDSKPVKAKGSKAKAVPAPEPVKEEVQERPNAEPPKEQRKGKKEKKQPSEDSESRDEVIPPLNTPQPAELTTEKLLKQVTAVSTASVATTASPQGGKKKKKAEPNILSLMAAGDGGGVNVSELVRVVREAALSRTEIQILTDALLNKHHDHHSDWTEGPNDPMQKLKKQLADKEKALTDELEASQTLAAKLKELRNTLNTERTRTRADMHTLQARIKMLMDDRQALAQDKHMLTKLAAEAEEAQAQRVQLEMHIQRLSESEAALVGQLNALQVELNARHVEAAAARDAGLMQQQHLADLAQQLQEANRAYGELEQQRQMAIHNEQMAQQELRQAQERLNSFNELQNEAQRLKNRLQAAEKATEEAEKQKQQLASEIAPLKEQLKACETELAELRQMKVAPEQNGLPPAGEQHKSAELAKVESVVEALRSELTAAQNSSRDQREQLDTLREQLQHYQKKNDELRTKNWKVMEALQSTEKALQSKTTTLPAQETLREAIEKAQESQYEEVSRVLRAACPAACPPSPAPPSRAGRAWLQAFADTLREQLADRNQQHALAEKTEKRAEESTKEKELVKQNEHLQALVDKYKRIIDDTEGVLSRLQHNVTTEEESWAQQLADKQRELDELRQRTVQQMQNKIEALEGELQQAKASNHNHSFADSERLAEERLLMAGLTDKHSTDVSNGPLQIGITEK